MYYATMTSCLGTILLRTDGAQLTGVHFSDQKDCPRHDPADPSNSRTSPAAGMMHGLPIRSFRIGRPADRGLFDDPIIAPGPSSINVRSARQADSRAGGLSLEQADTPPAARAIFKAAQAELDEYFAGKRREFTVPLQLQGTAFQKRVWEALLDVPYGHYVSYGELARGAGLEARHGRPVGTAVGRNPIAIIVPCHRVISGDGTLTGYTGGLERKVALLELEGFSVAQ